MIKIRTIIFLILFYLLGYTNFLGGPYSLAKFIFVLTVIGSIISLIFSWKIMNLSKKIIKQKEDKEIIKVDVKVIE